MNTDNLRAYAPDYKRQQHLSYLLSIVEHARPGVHAVRSDKPNEAGKYQYFKRDRGLTEDDLHRHLDGRGPFLAVYLGHEDGTTAMRVLDFDDHDGDLGFDKVCEAARRVCALEHEYGINGWHVRSGGGVGIHDWCFWGAEPQAIAAVRHQSALLLARAGLSIGAGGVAKGQVEVFPTAGGIGNPIALPFARKSTPLSRELGPVDIQPLWVISASVAVEPPPEPLRQLHHPPPPFADVVAALGAIPNDLDYDEWFSVMSAVAASTGKSEEGLEAFIGWSQTNTKHVDATSRKKWRSVDPTRSGFGSLINRARHCEPGWMPPSWHDVAPFSEQWLGIEFVARHSGEARYTAMWNRWHLWDGQRWRADETLRAFSMAQRVCRDAARAKNKGGGELLKAKTRAAALALARENSLLAAHPDQWDADPWLLGTPGGTVDLRTGLLKPGDPADHITKVTAVAPVGDCPLWLETLEQIFGDREVVGFLKRLFGYSLTGFIREEKLVFGWGGGGNGKGTVFETVLYVMGDYASTVPMSALVQRKHPEHPTEIADLCGRRLVIAGETEEGARWNTARIKLLTGGDRLKGRWMRADFFEFTPTFQLIVSSNDRPSFGRVDDAIRRRLVMVPFERSFSGEALDEKRKERLRAEGAGILRWMIEGCLEWQGAGLGVPEKLRVATRTYLDEADDVTRFIDDECIRADKAIVYSGPLYEAFVRWCRDRGIPITGTRRAFTERVQKDYDSDRGNRYELYFKGIQLYEEAF